jgi:hypothetical protein
MSGEEWYGAFMSEIGRSPHAMPLRDAAMNRRLRDWTQQLTAVVVATCDALDWAAAARGHGGPLPVKRGEYLALDVTAFRTVAGIGWPLPTAVFELENSPRDDYVGYAFWKALAVRAQLRVLLAYRAEAGAANALVKWLGEEVFGQWSLTDRNGTDGETLVVVGNRGEAATFPHGYFRSWRLNTNTSRFERHR